MPDRAWFMRMVRSPARQLLTGVREHYPGFESVDALHEFEAGIEADAASLFDLFSSVLGDCRETGFLRAGFIRRLIDQFLAQQPGSDDEGDQRRGDGPRTALPGELIEPQDCAAGGIQGKGQRECDDQRR